MNELIQEFFATIACCACCLMSLFLFKISRDIYCSKHPNTRKKITIEKKLDAIIDILFCKKFSLITKDKTNTNASYSFSYTNSNMAAKELLPHVVFLKDSLEIDIESDIVLDNFKEILEEKICQHDDEFITEYEVQQTEYSNLKKFLYRCKKCGRYKKINLER